ncbi:signal peptidase I [Leptolyngbya ohadii]|uniref:signal peptidase I n=1 Tax=Leptolyngbya ohadii TaxID=1962290 RepID=UPI000B59BCA7|nr:signal peptidase I [Leptolyngbya ohadii]
MASEPQNVPTPNAETASAQPKAEQSSGSWWSRLSKGQRDNLQILGIALVLAIVIRLLVAEPRYIPSDSMVPTLEIGDRLVVEKVAYRFRLPQRGDIVVFDPPPQLQQFGYAPDKAFIKRVIGTPGDVVQVTQGEVLINGQPLDEPYIAEPPGYEMRSVQVPAEQYFVMGDNRNNSNDSHVWGFLPRQNIIGRAVFCFYPFDRVGFLSLDEGFDQASNQIEKNVDRTIHQAVRQTVN